MYGILLIAIAQIPHDLPELLQCRFEVFHDLLGDDVGIGEVVGGFERFVFEPEDIEAGLVAGVIDNSGLPCRPSLLTNEICPSGLRPSAGRMNRGPYQLFGSILISSTSREASLMSKLG